MLQMMVITKLIKNIKFILKIFTSLTLFSYATLFKICLFTLHYLFRLVKIKQHSIQHDTHVLQFNKSREMLSSKISY